MQLCFHEIAQGQVTAKKGLEVQPMHFDASLDRRKSVVRHAACGESKKDSAWLMRAHFDLCCFLWGNLVSVSSEQSSQSGAAASCMAH